MPGHALDQHGVALADGDADGIVVPDIRAYELPEPTVAVVLGAGVLLLRGLVWLRRRRGVRAK